MLDPDAVRTAEVTNVHALLFEMTPREGREPHYFRRAEALRPRLAQHEGLLHLDRFRSLTRPGVILSHSHWRDEAALARWRSDGEHHRAQAAGRERHFENYRIRVSHALDFRERDGPHRTWTAAGAYADAPSTAPRYLMLVASEGEPSAGPGEAYESVNVTGHFLTVADVASRNEGEDAVAATIAESHVRSTLLALVSRDYGLFDRREAPQFFLDAPPPSTLP